MADIEFFANISSKRPTSFDEDSRRDQDQFCKDELDRVFGWSSKPNYNPYRGKYGKKEPQNRVQYTALQPPSGGFLFWLPEKCPKNKYTC